MPLHGLSEPDRLEDKCIQRNQLSKPIHTKVTDLLYIDDLTIFVASKSRPSCVLKSVKAAMEEVGLQWNPKKCAVAQFKRR